MLHIYGITMHFQNVKVKKLIKVTGHMAENNLYLKEERKQINEY